VEQGQIDGVAEARPAIEADVVGDRRLAVAQHADEPEDLPVAADDQAPEVAGEGVGQRGKEARRQRDGADGGVVQDVEEEGVQLGRVARDVGQVTHNAARLGQVFPDPPRRVLVLGVQAGEVVVVATPGGRDRQHHVGV